MTPFERTMLEYMELRGAPVSWAELRGQFVISEGHLTVVVNSLKRHLLIMQDRMAYALSSVGRAALELQARRAPFEGRAQW